jgi:1-acyl-sn-glycerol-3-phosphate acyltransferase
MAFLWSMIFVDPLIILSTIGFGSYSIALSFFDKSGRVMFGASRVWARSILGIARVRVTVEGSEHLDPKETYVFAGNHLSYMDTPVLLGNIPVEFRFMAKKGLFQIPFLGTHLIQAGHIPVSLEDPRAALKTLSRAAETIRQRGTSVFIFPEGGRSMDGVLQPFKEGAAYVAIKAGVRLVPVALVGTREVLAMGSATVHAAPVTLRIGEPIPVAGLTLRDREELTEQAREQVVQMLAIGARPKGSTR